MCETAASSWLGNTSMMLFWKVYFFIGKQKHLIWPQIWHALVFSVAEGSEKCPLGSKQGEGVFWQLYKLLYNNWLHDAWCIDKRWGQSKTKCRSQITSLKWEFLKRNVWGFRYKRKWAWVCCPALFVWTVRVVYSHLSLCYSYSTSYVSDFILWSYKYGYFLTNASLCFRRPLLTPWSCMDYFYDEWMHFFGL